MKTMAELIQAGCYFCKTPLTPETALVGTVSYALAGTDVWSKPLTIATCAACAEKHQAESKQP